MEDNRTEQSEPIGRLKLYLFAAIVMPLFMGVTLALQAGSMFYIFRSQTQVLQADIGNNDTGHWTPIKDMPGLPWQLETADDGSLWTATRIPGSISRHVNGRWEVFRGDQLGTDRNTPRHDFATAGNRVWAVFGDELLEFDGNQWQKHRIPNAAADHVIAANEKTVWVLGNDGLLRTRADGSWSTPQPMANAQVAQWDKEKTFRAPRLLAAADDNPWLCAKGLWRKHENQWKPVEFGGRPLVGPEVLGRAGGKLWLEDPLGLIWVAEDGQAHGQFSKQQLGLSGRQRIFSVHALGGKTCATSNKGIHVLKDGKWELNWPLPEGYHRCEALAASDGRLYTIALGPVRTAALWMVTALAAVLSGLGLLAIRLVLKPKYSMFRTLDRRRAFAMAAVTLPMILGTIAAASSGILPMLAPMGLSVLLLLAPPMLTILIVFKEMSQRIGEVVELRPIDDAQLPPAVVDWFEQKTPDVESLGFRRIGDFRLKKYREHFARFFISPDGDVFGEISCVKILPWKTIKCFSCFSTTDDLTYLETGTLNSGFVPVPKSNESDDGRFILQNVPKASVSETFDAHMVRLEQLAETRETRPICFVEDDLDKVIIHGQKLLHERMVDRGEITSNPYENVKFTPNEQPAAEDSPEELVEAV